MTNASPNQPWLRERAWLGYAGLTPFVLGVAALVASPDPGTRSLAADAVRYYAAVIASFLGAVHWGAVSATDDGSHQARLRWGVTPALLAWVLLFLPPHWSFVGFGVLFALILGVDRYLLPLLDDRYRTLRLRLTLVVVVALLVAAVLALEASP